MAGVFQAAASSKPRSESEARATYYRRETRGENDDDLALILYRRRAFSSCCCSAFDVLGSQLAPCSEIFQFISRKMLDANECVLRRTTPDELVKLHLDRRAVPVLGVLDEKDHQEGNDGCAGIYDELPSVRKIEYRTGDRPNDHHQTGENKSGRAPASYDALFAMAANRRTRLLACVGRDPNLLQLRAVKGCMRARGDDCERDEHSRPC